MEVGEVVYVFEDGNKKRKSKINYTLYLYLHIRAGNVSHKNNRKLYLYFSHEIIVVIRKEIYPR